LQRERFGHKGVRAAAGIDCRAGEGVYVDLSQAAYNYEDSADPAFVTDPGIRRRQLALAAPHLNQAESIVLQLLKQNPSNDDWKAALADIQVRLGTVEQGLNPSEDSATLSASGLATLKELAAKNPDSILILDSEVAALLTVKPLTLRDPQLAVACSQREVLLTKRNEPDVFLSLAQAYRSAERVNEFETGCVRV
jgi:hypothetical protein